MYFFAEHHTFRNTSEKQCNCWKLVAILIFKALPTGIFKNRFFFAKNLNFGIDCFRFWWIPIDQKKNPSTKLLHLWPPPPYKVFENLGGTLWNFWQIWHVFASFHQKMVFRFNWFYENTIWSNNSFTLYLGWYSLNNMARSFLSISTEVFELWCSF